MQAFYLGDLGEKQQMKWALIRLKSGAVLVAGPEYKALPLEAAFKHIPALLGLKDGVICALDGAQMGWAEKGEADSLRAEWLQHRSTEGG